MVKKSEQAFVLILELQQFTEYIEDIEIGMQFTRLGVFNPKFLKNDNLVEVSSNKLLRI